MVNKFHFFKSSFLLVEIALYSIKVVTYKRSGRAEPNIIVFIAGY